MPQLKNYAAGVKHAWVKTSDGNVYDLDAIVDFNGTPTMDDVPINGDDEVKTTFYFNQREELELVANGISFDIFQAITGNSYSSSAGGIQIALGTDSEKNPPFVEIGIEVTGKDSTDASITLRKTWYKVQIGSANINSSNGSELSVTFTGTAYKTSETVTGAALATARIATLETY